VIPIDSEVTGTELAIAAATNVLTLRAIAAAIGAPGWLGGIVAASSMAIASDPTAAPQLQTIAGILSAPGALAVEAIRSTSRLEPQAKCCAPCAAGTECETK
jgi:hypothetical protein